MKPKNKKELPDRTAARLASGAGSSPAFFDQVGLFEATRQFINREYRKLAKQPTKRRSQARINELKVRAAQLRREFDRFTES